MPCRRRRQATLLAAGLLCANAAVAAVCIGHAPSTILATVPSTTFTLAWMHSVEKIRWEEDYRVEDGGLVVSAARVRGSGAGMEPPAGAVWRNGAWEYQPAHIKLPTLRLMRSTSTSDYQICWHGRCRDLGALIGPIQHSGGETIEVFPCPSG